MKKPELRKCEAKDEDTCRALYCPKARKRLAAGWSGEQALAGAESDLRRIVSLARERTKKLKTRGDCRTLPGM